MIKRTTAGVLADGGHENRAGESGRRTVPGAQVIAPGLRCVCRGTRPCQSHKPALPGAGRVYLVEGRLTAPRGNAVP
jgi:hypothetical protein